LAVLLEGLDFILWWIFLGKRSSAGHRTGSIEDLMIVSKLDKVEELFWIYSNQLRCKFYTGSKLSTNKQWSMFSSILFHFK
jgi:hypothetical protein